MSEPKQEPVAAKPEQKKPFIDTYLSMADELFEDRLKSFNQQLSTTLDKMVSDRAALVEKDLKAVFGAKNRVVVNKADLIGFVRKTALETAESSRKTPTPLEKAGPEGAGIPEHPIDKLLKEYGVKVSDK